MTRLLFIVVLIIFSLSNELFANSDEDIYLHEAKTTISIFCELDGLGIRTSSLFWKFYKFFIDWNDEPGWDKVVVVSKYEIVSTKHINNQVHVEVNYFIDLEINNDDIYPIKSTTEKITYRLTKTGDYWKIHLNEGEFPPPPHLYRSAYLSTKKHIGL